jgi:hypothetical protein
MALYRSPSHLPEPARAKLAETLNARLADGLDLHSQIKVAHWNIKGPQFASLHPLFSVPQISRLAAGQSKSASVICCAIAASSESFSAPQNSS